ncbi:hypothetical protein [Hymenobacter convexus]|uniref:hypothetical protein n=1 Tax=Hymenobacter sp. CA1UV-4 TaxID=3063782 RepID=UPI0027139C7C|nr:hypothetical protein [Hymenobacter sp. CA1UV-4]MDO7853188.1 hypothetical protein [Hymenobacter sp. CA1UV-4]
MDTRTTAPHPKGFIELTFFDGGKFTVGIYSIALLKGEFKNNRPVTAITLVVGNGVYHVSETREAILELIRAAQ